MITKFKLIFGQLAIKLKLQILTTGWCTHREPTLTSMGQWWHYINYLELCGCTTSINFPPNFSLQSKPIRQEAHQRAFSKTVFCFCFGGSHSFLFGFKFVGESRGIETLVFVTFKTTLLRMHPSALMNGWMVIRR